MTEQEALEIITNIVQRQNVTKENDLALAITQKAIEKQIPKKPIKYDKYYYKCPVCSSDTGVSEEDLTIYEITPPNFCKKCGQALDWSEKE